MILIKNHRANFTDTMAEYNFVINTFKRLKFSATPNNA